MLIENLKKKSTFLENLLQYIHLTHLHFSHFPFRLLDFRGPVLRHLGGVRCHVFNRFHPESVRHLAGPVHPHQGSAQVSPPADIHTYNLHMKTQQLYK